MLDAKIIVKTDKESVFLLCNSLNAWIPPMRIEYPHLAEHLRDAQRLITKLYEENRELRGEEDTE